MEFFHGIVALLAFVVLVLAGMVAWLYMQQTRLLQAVNALAIAISTPPPPMLIAEPPKAVEETPVAEETGGAPDEEDDRVSVYEEEDESTVVEETKDSGEVGEIVDYTKKTIAELRDLLTQKGIPFNKSDKKTTLVSLIQATA